MKYAFIVFINDKVWQRYTRRPHFSSLSKLGDLIILEYPLTLLSKSFLKHPIKEFKNYFKYSRGKRIDILSDAQIIRPIIIFPVSFNYLFFEFINKKILWLFISNIKIKSEFRFYFLTNYDQSWFILKRLNNKYILDMNDEWSLFAEDISVKKKIKTLTEKSVNKVDLVMCVTKKLKEDYNYKGTSFFVPNAVDINHYVPKFDNEVKKKKELPLNFDEDFLKKNDNDASEYSKSINILKSIDRPIIGAISGISQIWTGYNFIQEIEELIPDMFSMVSSGLIHTPSNKEYLLEYENYKKSHRTKFLGHIDYSILPDFLEMLSVGLVFYKKSELNKYSAPNKIWAYLAMGLPIVSTNFLDEMDKEVYEDNVSFANSSEEYVEHIIKAYETDSHELKMKRRKFAVQNSTIGRAKKMIKIIKD